MLASTRLQRPAEQLNVTRHAIAADVSGRVEVAPHEVWRTNVLKLIWLEVGVPLTMYPSRMSRIIFDRNPSFLDLHGSTADVGSSRPAISEQ